MNFEEYKKLMDRQFKINDVRERAFQDNVIRPFLRSVFSQYDVEPTDKRMKQSVFHDYSQYSGSKKIKTSTGELVDHLYTPDLCIAENWNWWNIVNKVNYKCVVEIKSPEMDRVICTSKTIKSTTINDIKCHLSVNDNVILTDGIVWLLYQKKKEKTLTNYTSPIYAIEGVVPLTFELGIPIGKTDDDGNRIIINRKMKIARVDWNDEKIFDALRQQLIMFLSKQ